MQHEYPIFESVIPSIHQNIELTHLKANGKFFFDDEIKNIKREMQEAKSNERVYGTRDEKIAHGSVLFINEKYYVTYDNHVLGKGSFGEVVIAQELDSGELVAIKKQNLEVKKDSKERKTRPKDPTSMLELRKQLIAKEEHGRLGLVGKSYGAILDEKSKSYSIAMKLASGIELSGLTGRQMATTRRLQIAMNAINSIASLHEAGLLHCDIKGSNFITNPISGQTSWVDLGLALKVKDIKSGVEFNRVMGTPGYVAPEIYTEKLYSEASEVYALGKTIGELCGLIEEQKEEKRITETSRGSEIEIIVKPFDRLVVDRNSNWFRDNRLIPDKKVRADILALLKKMTHLDPHKRLSLKEAKESLQEIIDTQITLTGKINNVGLINIKEFKEIMEEKDENRKKEKLEPMLGALRYFDEIWFIDPGNEVSKLDIMKLRRNLENEGIYVGDRMFSNHSVDNIVQQIPDHENRIFPNAINLHFFVTSDQENAKKVQNKEIRTLITSKDSKPEDYRKFINEQYKDMMLPAQIKFAINELEKNAQYLRSKYFGSKHYLNAKRRSRLINSYIDELKRKNNKITYADLIKGLEALQQKMTPTGIFSQIFHIASTAGSRIKAIREKFKKEEKEKTQDKLETRAKKGG